MSFFEDSIAVVERPMERLESLGTFWRPDTPVIDAQGALRRGGMFPAQRRWWELPNFIKVLVGGYGSGKTHIGAKRIISLALANAPCPVASVSPTFPIARQTTIVTIAELLAGKQTHYGRSFWWKYNAGTHEFRIRFHGRNAHILIYSGERPESLRGPNLAAAHIDEPFIMDEDVFKQMIARVRHPEAQHREICITGTPEQLNWGYDLCVGEGKERHDVATINVSTRENLALDEGYVGRLLGAFDGRAADAYVEGKFVNLSSGMVYYAFNQEANVVDLPIPSPAELGVGMDFNVNPMAAVVFWHAGTHMHFFDEIELPNADTEYMCQYLTEKYGVGSKFHLDHETVLTEVYPDATGSARKTSAPGGKTDFHYIRNAGFDLRAPHANPKRKDRYNAVNGKFKSRSGHTTLTVSPQCKKLIKYLSIYSHELMPKQDAMSHLLDAFGYPVSYLHPVTKDMVSILKLTGV